MPTYEYQCKMCGHQMEEFQSMSEEPLKHCPECGTDNLVRVLGTGAGLIFKGTGFYLTDYRKSHVSRDEGDKKREKAETKDGKATPGPTSEKKD